MQKSIVGLLCLCWQIGFRQITDFATVNFAKADIIAKNDKAKGNLDIYNITTDITQNLTSDVEKVRAIYVWITHNIANDYSLYARNNRKRKKFQKDSIRLDEWNSRFKKKLFRKLLKKKRTICTGYAMLFTEMCNVIDIKSSIVHGFGRTADVNFDGLAEANHTWNVVQINNKWYLVDATWAAGISYPNQRGFEFNFNEGYFLTSPDLFINNHFPIEPIFTLLPKPPSFQEFAEKPMVYGAAYKYFKEIITPRKMYHEIRKDSSISFEFKLLKQLDASKIKMILTKGKDREVKPEINLENNTLNLSYKFTKASYYDVHLYYKDEILISYTVNVLKNEPKN